MSLTREKKEQVLKDIKGFLKDSSIVAFVNFHGLTNVLAQELRRLVAKSGAKYFVAKKTLVKKSLGEENYSGETPELEGELGLVFGGEDIVAPVQGLAKFSKEHPEQINILGGVFDGSFMDKIAMSKIANLPTREVLLWQLVNVINAPRQQVVGVLQAPIRDFVSVLKQIKQ